MKVQLRKGRSAFNSSRGYGGARNVVLKCDQCDQCGVLFSRKRAAVKARDIHRPDCQHEFCGMSCTQAYRAAHGPPFDGVTP